MTTTNRLAALAAITRAIFADMIDRPHFTLTRDQLRNRIIAYCDDPATTDADIDAIFNCAIILDELPIRD